MINLESFYFLIRFLLDLSILWFIIFFILKLVIRSKSAILVLKTITVIILINLISNYFKLEATSWFTNQFITWGVVIIFILFQDDIRKGIENFSKYSFSSLNKENKSISNIEKIQPSIIEFSKTKTGSLITIEQTILLNDYIEKGINIDAKISYELLNSIFNKNSSMHDGSVIIRNDRIVATNVYFQINKNINISKTMGTRHRAAISMSSDTDALIIITSEETGSVSIAYLGKLYYDIDPENLNEKVSEILEQKEK